MHSLFAIPRLPLHVAFLTLIAAGLGSAIFAQDRVGALSPIPLTDGASTPGVTSGQESTPAVSPSPGIAGLLIGDGDLLQVSLYGVPDFNQQVRVSGKGEITLPMIGQIQVRGLSTAQVEAIITKGLKDGGFFNEPQISVLNKEFATQGISILGEVQKPGIYPLLGPRKLFDVLSTAGGTAPRAGRDIMISHRATPQVVQTVTLTDDPKRAMDANVDVFPGDTVLVAKAGLVYVVGDVKLPGGFMMDKDKDLTVLQALALAQGAAPYASLNLGKLLHRTPSGVVETPVDLKAILAGKSEDLRMRAEDILFIPHNGKKEVTRMALQTILQTAAAVSIYKF